MSQNKPYYKIIAAWLKGLKAPKTRTAVRAGLEAAKNLAVDSVALFIEVLVKELKGDDPPKGKQ